MDGYAPTPPTTTIFYTCKNGTCKGSKNVHKVLLFEKETFDIQKTYGICRSQLVSMNWIIPESKTAYIWLTNWPYDGVLARTRSLGLYLFPGRWEIMSISLEPGRVTIVTVSEYWTVCFLLITLGLAQKPAYVIGFNHGLPCYVKNMAQGTQVD